MTLKFPYDSIFDNDDLFKNMSNYVNLLLVKLISEITFSIKYLLVICSIIIWLCGKKKLVCTKEIIVEENVVESLNKIRHK